MRGEREREKGGGERREKESTHDTNSSSRPLTAGEGGEGG